MKHASTISAIATLVVAGAALLQPVPVEAAYRRTVAAVPQSAMATVTRAKPRPVAPRAPAETLRALPVVSGIGPGQAGYVHYWVIAGPEGEEEMHTGIELADGRIAWSFPERGVEVTAFVQDGEIDARGRRYRVQHLYGLRPFADDRAMQVLRERLEQRVAAWVDDETVYCFSGRADREREICLSCMGFVMQLLFPGRTPVHPEIPRDFPRVGEGLQYTTEDLLLYMTRLHALPTGSERRQRIAAIGGPKALQEELIRLSAQLADEKLSVAEAKSQPQKRRVSTRPPAPKPLVRRPAG